LGYYSFLSAVSVFAIGVVLLQVAANPYVNALGTPETAASRLTLTNALNSMATIIAPLFVSILIVSTNTVGAHDPKTVQGPFAAIGIATLVIVVIMFFLKLPEIKLDETAKVWQRNSNRVPINIPTCGWVHWLSFFIWA